MGSPLSEHKKREDHEGPQTMVTLTQGFWLGRTEVTQEQWSVMMDPGRTGLRGSENLPVENVSWEEAMRFCSNLTTRERSEGRLPAGYAYTLPTEAQWEYACRAGTTAAYAGSLAALAWYVDTSGVGKTLDQQTWLTSYSYNTGSMRPVATKRANAWGFFDMHGNVSEWCLDWYTDSLPGGDVSDPKGPESGSFRIGVTSGSFGVIRGGAWMSEDGDCRSAYRRWYPKSGRTEGLGFRVALAAVEAGPGDTTGLEP